MDEPYIFAVVAAGCATVFGAMRMIFKYKMARLGQMESVSRMNAQTESRLAAELDELRQTVHEQAILLDDLSSMHRRLLERSANEPVIKNRV